MIKLRRATVHEALKTDAAFKAVCKEARDVARDELEGEVIRRVYEGSPVLYRGEPVKGVRTYDNRLLMDVLRAAWPEKYGRRVHHDTPWPAIEKMIAENDLTLEQLDAIAAGMPANVVLAMTPERADTVSVNLEPRASSAGRDTIDHPPGGHDGVINAGQRDRFGHRAHHGASTRHG